MMSAHHYFIHGVDIIYNILIVRFNRYSTNDFVPRKILKKIYAYSSIYEIILKKY